MSRRVETVNLSTLPVSSIYEPLRPVDVASLDILIGMSLVGLLYFDLNRTTSRKVETLEVLLPISPQEVFPSDAYIQ